MVNIVIDPGHGGFDPGAVANSLREADVNLEVALAAAEALFGKYGVQVVLTREDDEHVSLEKRVRIANVTGADLFLSIHANAGGGTGFESYSHPGAPARTRELHERIHRGLAEFFANYNRQDRGMKQENLYVLRETQMPAILLECLFLDHPEDAALLKQPEFRRKLGEAVARAVFVALGLEDSQDNWKSSGREETEPSATSGRAQLYRVQVGAFAEKENAETLVEKLRRAGYETYIVKKE